MDALDPDFKSRLHDILSLCDQTGIYVILDNHGDMVGSQGCGNGVPTWVQIKAAPHLIGMPLVTDFPYNRIPSITVENVPGFSYCGMNASKWLNYAGNPNYNLMNECCQQMNSGGNPGGLGYTTISQATMNYIISPGEGRDSFVRFWSLVAQEVMLHPSAFAAELMNEPMTIKRQDMYDTWRAVAIAINTVIPDMSVSICDVGEGAVMPSWITDIVGAGFALNNATVDWIRNSTTLFYSWHWYGAPATPEEAVKNVMAIQNDWNVPSFLTEFGDCAAWPVARAANISHSYWHYSSYCNTGASFGNRTVPEDTFGACILGWADGNSSNCT